MTSTFDQARPVLLRNNAHAYLLHESRRQDVPYLRLLWSEETFKRANALEQEGINLIRSQYRRLPSQPDASKN